MNSMVQKYLSNRAILSPWQLVGSNRKNFAAAVIIPALDERATLPKTLSSLSKNPSEYLAKTLVVVVVNNRRGVSTEVLVENQATLDWLQSSPFPQLNLVWIDASSPGLELGVKEGVGLARKIGFDTSLSLLNWQIDPILISLDADTLVDSTYLSAIFSHFQQSKTGGTAIPFRHQPARDEKQERAIRQYELYLRSYMFGLQLAGSPYAYHTIGSAFACRATAYIKSGGMNRRCGGEDFYFLQQVAKVSGVDLLTGTVVHPSPRFSDRVAFGTGKAVEGQVVDGMELFDFVSAKSFKVLRDWFELASEQIDESAAFIHEVAAELSAELTVFLGQLDFVDVWRKQQKNHSCATRRLAAFHAWFDALRTRQLLTRLEKKRCLSAENTVAELLEWGGLCNVHEPELQLSLLEGFYGVTPESKNRKPLF